MIILIKENCFAYIKKEKKCNALCELNCDNCSFYRDKSTIKANPFYPYSYASKIGYLNDLRNYKINIKEVNFDE